MVDLCNPGLIALNNAAKVLSISLCLVHLRVPAACDKIFERGVHEDALRFAADCIEHPFRVVSWVLNHPL